MSQILIFGDSIAYGAWDRESGWAERLRKIINKKIIASGQKFYCTVYNLSIDGNTTKDLLNRFAAETKQRQQEKETIFIFAIGGNDAVSINNKKLLIPKKNFENNIKNLIKLSLKFSSKIFFIGVIPVDESKTNPLPWDKTMFNKNEYLKSYDEIIKSICKKDKVHFIEIFKEFEKRNYKNLLEDGVHPNSEGHKIIFNAVKNSLSKNKII